MTGAVVRCPCEHLERLSRPFDRPSLKGAVAPHATIEDIMRNAKTSAMI